MSVDAPELSVIIPVFNKWELTRDCLESLRQHTEGCDFEVLVADNGSSDATAQECPNLGAALFPGRFRHLRFETNLNFGPACNAGAKAASGALLLFLNNDTLLWPGWLPPLLAALRSDGGVGAVGPLLVYPERLGLGPRVQHLGIVVEPQLYPRHLHEYFPVDHPLVRKRRSVQALTAAALLLRRSLFFECGGFCEDYRNGGEDVELGVQIARRGYSQFCVPESRVTHLVGQTPGRTDNERHNAQVLKARCRADLVPDLAYHAQKDGYELRLTECLRPYLALPARRAEVLNRRAQAGLDPQLCRELLAREPLWLEGYGLLARHCEAAGDLTGACAQRFLESRFAPTEAAFTELLRLSELCAEEGCRRSAESWLLWRRQESAGADLVASALEAADYMERLRLPEVAALYRGWAAGKGRAATF